MLQFFTSLLVSSFFLSTAWSKCPAFETSCFQQKSGLKLTVEKITPGIQAEFEISPLTADFKNIVSPGINQYINFEYKLDGRPSKVFFMSYICSGQTPLSSDAFSQDISRVLELGDINESLEIFISTGEAAGTEYFVNQSIKQKVKIYDHFLEAFEDQTSEDIERTNVFVPSVLNGLYEEELSQEEKKLYSTYFSQTNSTLNGCSQNFQEKMKHFKVENVIQNKPFKGISLNKKWFSPKYKMTWAL